MRDETKDRLLGLSAEVRLKKGEVLIPCGKVDDNLYIIADGIIRRSYFDGLVERTLGFADNNGGVLIDYHGYYMHEPAVLQYESCCKSVVMKISKSSVEELSRESDDFNNWLKNVYMQQAYMHEKISVIVTGTVRERLEAMQTNRPQILEKVPLRIIASYIGVTPQYVSMMRAKLTSKT